MRPDEPHRTPPPVADAAPQAAAPGAVSRVVVSPVIVLSREFPARPAALPDAQEFVRSTLAAADMQEAPHAAVTEAISAALLAAARPDIGSFVVAIRIFPDEAEVEVLSQGAAAPLPATPATSTAGSSFAAWLARTLRAEGLSQEAAARQLGVSVRTVSRWVRGQTEPRLRDVRRLTDLFGPVPPQ